MAHGPRARIHLASLRHNLQRARQAAPHSRVIAILKADGYGHGLLRVARTLEGESDRFGVARLEEAIALRRAGTTRPIVLLEGFLDQEELAAVAHHRLEPVIHHLGQIELLERHPPGLPLHFWLKVESGMHRLGLSPAQLPGAIARLTPLLCGDGTIRCMSHLACADDLHNASTHQQQRLFAAAVPPGIETSLANSAGILGWPQTCGDWIRPGIMLYGASPLLQRSAEALELRPAMTLESCLIATQPLQKGEAVGYGASWHAPEAMRVGVVRIGYGDGYPRLTPSGTPTLIAGKVAPLVGRVSMDLITLDLRGHPDARVGDRVVLWGEGLPVEEIAGRVGTIAYELLCGVTSRVERVEA